MTPQSLLRLAHSYRSESYAACCSILLKFQHNCNHKDHQLGNWHLSITNNQLPSRSYNLVLECFDANTQGILTPSIQSTHGYGELFPPGGIHLSLRRSHYGLTDTRLVSNNVCVKSCRGF